jgi:hypothetical protein
MSPFSPNNVISTSAGGGQVYWAAAGERVAIVVVANIKGGAQHCHSPTVIGGSRAQPRLVLGRLLYQLPITVRSQ